MDFIMGIIIVTIMIAGLLLSSGVGVNAVLLTLPFVVGGGLLLFVLLKVAHGINAHFPEPKDEQHYYKKSGVFVGRFTTVHEARTICDALNQNGDRMYVRGNSIYVDGNVDVREIRKEVGRQHDIYADCK